MKDIPEPLRRIRTLVDQKRYRIRMHAVQHMIKVGSFVSGESAVSPLHVLCDHSNDEIVDIVMAYIPQKPWWQTETKRGRIQ